MKITFLSNVPQVGTFRLGSHHLAREMSALGHSVCHVSTPVSRWELATSKEVSSRRMMLKGKPLAAGKADLARGGAYIDDGSVTHYSPVPWLPVRIYHNSKAVTGCLSAVGFDDSDVVLIDQLHLSSALKGYEGTIVYRPTDVVPDGFGRDLQRKVVAMASGIVACSPVVLKDLDAPGPERARIVIENGVDLHHFGDGDLSGVERSGVVYVGAIDFRFDWDFLIQCAMSVFPERVVLAGPVVGGSVPSNIPSNVELVGAVDYSSLPSLLSSFKVGILPLNSDPSNAGRSPMKFYEYLACKLYVVSTSTDTLAARAPVPGSFLFSHYSDGISSVARFLDQAGPNTAGCEFARSQSWESKAKVLERFLQSLQNEVER